jgi:predicted NBD/HSP70 family sugar kinase
MKKATRQHTHNHNTQLVLKTIYDQPSISRADIARLTRLTRPTVSAIVAELMQEKLVLETGLGPSAGGKPPMLLNIDADAHRLLCVDLGSQEFRGALLNLQGEITRRAHFPTGDRRGEAALQLVYELLDELVLDGPGPVLGIGIGAPGLINPEEGLIHRAVNLGWEELPLGEQLEERYQLPVYVTNDSHLAALGEYTYGEGRAGDNLIVIRIGQGIGAGIVLGGQLYHGDGFTAGEIGHVVVSDQGERCRCGNLGCLETVAGTRALLAAARAAGVAEDWPALVEAVAAGDERARNIVAEAGCYLGVVIANLIGAFSIYHIILSGRVDQLGDVFLQAAYAEAMRRALPAMVSRTTLEYSRLGRDIVILGASALILQQELGII